MTKTGGNPFASPLRWIGPAALFVTSIWTGAAGGVGIYAQRFGTARAWTAVGIALGAVESGKLFAAAKHHEPSRTPHKR
jgi:hypothetical protein